MDYPKLRDLEPFPVVVSGKKMIGLRDPLNLTEGAIAFPPQLYPILILLDGRHSLLDIQAQYMRKFGELLYKETLQDIVGKLDDALFLDNDKFRELFKKTVSDFRKSSVRPAALAGKGYETSPLKLADELQGFFSSSDGPGLPDRKKRKRKSLKGIIAPHIDLTRGGPCFAWAYKELAESCKAKTFVVFGTSHAPTKQPFALTFKDFETPFGQLKCNRDLAKAIQSRVPYDLLEDEFVHRSEHSIEFQAVFLKYLFQKNDDVSFIPILCGSFHELTTTRSYPASNGQIGEFLSAVKQAVEAVGEDVCYIAGADLAHVGPRFGDTGTVNDGSLKLLEQEDLQMLDFVVALDAEGFAANIQADGNRRHVCGFPPIYAMLSVMQAKTAKMLKYQQWRDPDATVTYASVAFY